MLFTCIASKFSEAQTFSVKNYTVADGLPTGSVENLFTDSHGYLWLSTYTDLFRYDGTSFNKFGIADGLNCISSFITFEDSKGNLWGTGANNGTICLLEYSAGKFTTTPFDEKDSAGYFFSVFETKEKQIWACTARGIFWKNGNSLQRINIGIDSTTTVRRIVQLSDQSLLICAQKYILKKREGRPVDTVAEATQSGTAGFLNILNTGNKIYVHGYDRLFYYTDHGLIPFGDDLTNHQYVSTFIVDHSGRIYAGGSDSGLMIFENKKQTLLGKKTGINPGFISSICEDREGNIWVGNIELTRIKPSFVQHYTTENGLQFDDTRSLFMNHLGNMYFGGTGEGFYLWDKNKFITSIQLLSPQELLKLNDHILLWWAEDNKQRIWMLLHSSKIFLYSNNHLEDVSAKFNPSRKRVGQLVFNNTDSAMYIAGDSLRKIKNDKIVETIPITIDNKPDRPYLICLDHDYRLWIGTSERRLGYIDLLHPHPPGLPSKFVWLNKSILQAPINRIKCAPDGSVWVATSGEGLAHFFVDKTGNIIKLGTISEKDGLKSNVAGDLCFDGLGFLWVLSIDGVTRFDLNPSSEGKKIISSQPFGEDDGINPKSYVDSHIDVDASGDIWVSGYSGLYKFIVKNITNDSLPPLVHIETISILNDSSGGKKFSNLFTPYAHLPENPKLPFSNNTITIHFNTVSFTNRDNLECEYRLEGLENNWTSSAPKSAASYVNLPVGNYTFHVRARRKGFEWSKEATYTFSVTPPFWQTWWFRLLSILAASSILIYAFRTRIRQINKKSEVQQQMQELEMQALKARMNPHFIYNAMNSIQSLVVSNEPESAVRYLGKFAKLLRQVLDNSDQSLIPLSRELSSLELYIELEALRLHVDFDYEIFIDDKLNTDEESLPPLTLQPFVENALWHGLSNKQGTKKLTIKIYPQQNYLITEISDNGIGRIKATEIKSKNISQSVSKGLNITNRRLMILNNENTNPVTIEDIYDANGNAAGTKVTIRILRKIIG